MWKEPGNKEPYIELEDMNDDEKNIVEEKKIEGKAMKFSNLENFKKKAICKIEYGGFHGTGFFWKIPNPLNDNKNTLNVLLTCYHVLPLEKKGLKINLFDYYIDNKKKTLNLNGKNRLIRSCEGLDYTCIEILKDDNIDEYFDVDENLINSNPKEYLKEVSIFSCGYLQQELYFDFKNIKKIGNRSILHNCNTEEGWSGGPIFNSINQRVIAIHKNYHKDHKYNTGLLIKSVINDLKRKDNKDIDSSDEFDDKDEFGDNNVKEKKKN